MTRMEEQMAQIEPSVVVSSNRTATLPFSGNPQQRLMIEEPAD